MGFGQNIYGIFKIHVTIIDARDYPRIYFDRTYACRGDVYDRIKTEPHKLSLDQVRNYSAWFMGDNSSTLTPPPNKASMIIKAVDPNARGNQGLVTRRKILLRQYSGMLNMILKNHLQRTSFTSLNPKSETYLYTDEVSGRRIACGLVKLKLAIEIINPQLVVDHAIKEQDLENLTLLKCGNNVHTYLTTLQER